MPITRGELSPGREDSQAPGPEGPGEGEEEGEKGGRGVGKMDREPGLPNLPPR